MPPEEQLTCLLFDLANVAVETFPSALISSMQMNQSPSGQVELGSVQCIGVRDQPSTQKKRLHPLPVGVSMC